MQAFMFEFRLADWSSMLHCAGYQGRGPLCVHTDTFTAENLGNVRSGFTRNIQTRWVSLQSGLSERKCNGI